MLLSLMDAAQAVKGNSVGYGMTEFLVNRSYADKSNLLAYVLHQSSYYKETAGCVIRNIDQIIHALGIRVTKGGPMAK